MSKLRPSGEKPETWFEGMKELGEQVHKMSMYLFRLKEVLPPSDVIYELYL